jgi:hypothetical protein
VRVAMRAFEEGSRLHLRMAPFLRCYILFVERCGRVPAFATRGRTDARFAVARRDGTATGGAG